MKPNPGSNEAIDQGCTCPVMDNARGKGIPVPNGDGTYSTAFWMSGSCPIHGFKPRQEEAEAEEV